MDESNRTTYLEPRVARLETGLETLTRNVSDLASSIRENSNSTNQKIDSLVIAVTQAQAPKKTDWSLLISIGFFILALGSAVFWPLNKDTQENKVQIERTRQTLIEHTSLSNHPVGEVQIQELDRKYGDLRVEMVTRDATLDAKIQRETQLMTELLASKLVDLDTRIQKEFSIKNDRTDSRLTKIEDFNKEQALLDQEELRKWRADAMDRSITSQPDPHQHK